MRRILLALAISAIATASIFAGSAAASGPAAPGKEVIEAECVGLGSITIAVQKSEKSHGAAQIVGQKGHLIPVAFTFVVTDVTTKTVLETETEGPHGKAHSKQTTTTCSGTFFEGTASELAEGEELPPGVEPDDVLRGTFEVEVVVKK